MTTVLDTTTDTEEQTTTCSDSDLICPITGTNKCPVGGDPLCPAC